jgi:hypothetical protein
VKDSLGVQLLSSNTDVDAVGCDSGGTVSKLLSGAEDADGLE